MTEKELKRLRRSDLLELLLAQSKENQKLQQELEEARAQLADQAIKIEKAGSMAEAALQLSGIFEAADRACTQYLENIRMRNQEEDIKDMLRSRMQEHCASCPRWEALFDPEQPLQEESQ